MGYGFQGQGHKTCTFDGCGSRDPDGSIVAFRWAETNGTTLSTQPIFTKTVTKAGRNTVVLYVTDNGGLTASKSAIYTVLR
jgi:chitodextrinase